MQGHGWLRGSGRHRRSIRLHGYDYSQPGAYFITVCTKDRACLFGEVENDMVIPTAHGEIAVACWEAIPDHFPGVELDAYVVMPNHLHGIVVLGTAPDDGDVDQAREKGTACRERFGKPVAGSLPTIVRSFKAAVTKRFRENEGDGAVLWHRNYYEHIIRNERALDRIRQYIRDNPSRWADDDENPTHLVRARHAVPPLPPAVPPLPPGPPLSARPNPSPAPPTDQTSQPTQAIPPPVRARHAVPPTSSFMAGQVPAAVPSSDHVPVPGHDGREASRARHAVPLPCGTAHIGEIAILDRQPLVALFCSSRCPGRLILKTYDLACELRDAGITVIGGFHTPMERECLTFLLKGAQPVILCPARGIEGMRLLPEWRDAVNSGRLLLLSAIPAHERRVTAALAVRRNAFVAGLADQLLVPHATPGGKLETLCRQLLATAKPLLTFDDPDNANLLTLGAKPLTGHRWT